MQISFLLGRFLINYQGSGTANPAAFGVTAWTITGAAQTLIVPNTPPAQGQLHTVVCVANSNPGSLTVTGLLGPAPGSFTNVAAGFTVTLMGINLGVVGWAIISVNP